MCHEHLICLVQSNKGDITTPSCYLATPLVAFRINWATSSGWDRSDRLLEGSDRVVAFICFANECSRAGGRPRSFSNTSRR